MPELPEVESVRRALEPSLKGRRVAGVSLERPEVVAHPSAEAFCAGVTGRAFAGIDRRGKFLRLELDDGGVLALHLRMTGRLLLLTADASAEPHTRAVFALDDGRRLCFADTRRFGRFWLLRPGEADEFTGMARLGPEPFDPRCNAACLRAACGGSRRAIKACLLDQSVLAGVGNIYSDEILFAARIRPDRPARTLGGGEWRRLAKAVPEVMRFFTEKNIVTPEQYARDAGLTYRNTPYLRVYGHAGEPCPVCGTTLARMVVAGRGSVFCPRCQGNVG